MQTPELTALRIQRQIKRIEDAIDSTLGESGELLTSLTKARLDSGVPAATGHLAMARVSDVQQNLMKARQDLLRTYAELASTISRLYLNGLSHSLRFNSRRA